MPRSTWEYQSRSFIFFAYRTFTFYGSTSQQIRLKIKFVTSRGFCQTLHRYPATLNKQRQQALTLIKFGLLPLRSPLLGEYLTVSFPPGTEMFHFPGLSPLTLKAPRALRHYPEKVFLFGNLRVKGCLHLTAAYRNLLRPSSSAPAKSSTTSSS